MPALDAASCQACGGNVDLLQCVTCPVRLGDRGTKTAICKQCCATDADLESVGKTLAAGSANQADFQCHPCGLFTKRQVEAKLLAAVGGPSPDDILKTIARTAPWFLVLRQASDEEKLNALH